LSGILTMERYTRNYEDSEKVGKIVILRERSDEESLSFAALRMIIMT
jgi:hypothetical protein